MTLKSDIAGLIEARVADAWPGVSLLSDPVALTGGFWASMYRIRLRGQPADVPTELVFRIAPDATMGAKELAVQHVVAELGCPTPHVRLIGPADAELGGTWSVMDFAVGAPPLGDLDGIGALRRAPRLLSRLPGQLAAPMTALHALDPGPVSDAVRAAAPTAAWSVDQLLHHFGEGAEALGRSDLVGALRALTGRRPLEGPTVICHGDLHPFNLLVQETGEVTVIDWTASIRAEPAYDVAFTALLLANPPLAAPAPLAAVIRRVGARVARRFEARYRALAPGHDLAHLDWYRALHGTRILLEAAGIEARDGAGGDHPFGVLIPAATAALTAVTGARLAR